MSTITVRWATTVVEHHRAEIDAEVWRNAHDGDYTDVLLSDLEGEETRTDTAVTERDYAINEGENDE